MNAKEAREILDRYHGKTISVDVPKWLEDSIRAEEYLAALEGPEVGKLVAALIACKSHVDAICEQLERDGWAGPTEADINQRKAEEALTEFRKAVKGLEKGE